MRRWLATAAVIVAAIALLVLLLSGGGQAPSTQPKRVILFAAQVEGAGVIYVNGTPVRESISLNSTKPFRLVLEASPLPCHRLAGWLVNGSELEAAANLTIRVAGNTTVVAKFEKPVYRVLVVSGEGGAGVVVNGSRLGLPASVEAPACSVLVVEPIAAKGYEPLNGTLCVQVAGNVTVRLSFRRILALVRLEGLIVPVYVNETLYESDAELWVRPGSTIRVVPLADDRGCGEYNETHLACIVSWLINGTEYPGRGFTLRVSGDTVLREVVAYTEREHPVKYIEVEAPNGTIKVPVIPADRWMVWPFRATYEYLGNGWFMIRGAGPNEGYWLIYLALPDNWKRVRIYLNYTKLHRLEADTAVEVVIKNSPFFAIGVYLNPCCMQTGTGYNVVVFDKGLIGFLKNWGGSDQELFEAYRRYIRCRTRLETGGEEVCGLAYSGPGPRSIWAVKPGWIFIGGEGGVLYFKVEILEYEGGG